MFAYNICQFCVSLKKKDDFMGLQTTKAQAILCIRAVRSVHLLFALLIVRYAILFSNTFYQLPLILTALLHIAW